MADSIAVGGNAGHDHDRGRTLAQWYCLIAGAALLLAGIFGFLSDSTFDTSGSTDSAGGNMDGMLQGDSFLGFEVNGWHNVVHILSGLFLLAMFRRRKTAKTAAIAFGIVYGIVAIIGLINGNDVLGIIPVNPADNILHILLSLLGLGAGLLSDGHDRATVGGSIPRGGAADRGVSAGRGTTTERERVGTGRTLTPEDHDRTTGRR